MRRILRLDFSFLRNGFALCASIPQLWGYVSQSGIAFPRLREWFPTPKSHSSNLGGPLSRRKSYSRSPANIIRSQKCIEAIEEQLIVSTSVFTCVMRTIHYLKQHGHKLSINRRGRYMLRRLMLILGQLVLVAILTHIYSINSVLGILP